MLIPPIYINETMKKVSTEPKSLGKLKTPPVITQWYISGAEDEAEASSSNVFGGQLHHAATTEVLQPLRRQASNSGIVSGSPPVSAVTDINDVDLHVGVLGAAETSRSKIARDRLQAKITRIVDMISAEQTAKEENVNEYLRLSAADITNRSASSSDRHQANTWKAAFEKRNQKSTERISHLQRKLEAYSHRMRDFERHGPVLVRTGANMRPGQKQAKAVFSHGIKSVTSMPKEFAHMIRSKFGSADNIKALADLDSSNGMKPDGTKRRKGSGTLPSDFKYHSEENILSLVCNETSPPPSGSGDPSLSPQFCSGGGHHIQNQQSWSSEQVSVEMLLRELDRSRELQMELQDCVVDYQGHIEESQAMLRQLLEEQRLRGEHLEEQLNDMMELHQHEITDIKQELSSLEEKMEYQLEERTRDMQDVLESCQTKITKMELQQQQQQLISMEGFDGSRVRILLSKLINVVLALLAVILVLLHTAIHLVGPFLNTRLRCIVTTIAVTVAAVLYHNRHAIFRYTKLTFLSEA